MAKEKNEIIKEAEKELEYLTGDEEVKRMAFLHEKWERDYNSGMKNAREEGIKQGLEEGLEQGIKQGLEEGLEQGIEQGIEEGQRREKIEVAKKMKKESIPIEVIEKVTGLSKDEIEKLKC